MMDAFERHNAEVRAGVPADRLLEWTASDGWEPICERLGVAVPNEAFPAVNSTNETRAMLGHAAAVASSRVRDEPRADWRSSSFAVVSVAGAQTLSTSRHGQTHLTIA